MLEEGGKVGWEVCFCLVYFCGSPLAAESQQLFTFGSKKEFNTLTIKINKDNTARNTSDYVHFSHTISSHPTESLCSWCIGKNDMKHQLQPPINDSKHRTKQAAQVLLSTHAVQLLGAQQMCSVRDVCLFMCVFPLSLCVDLSVWIHSTCVLPQPTASPASC